MSQLRCVDDSKVIRIGGVSKALRVRLSRAHLQSAWNQSLHPIPREAEVEVPPLPHPPVWKSYLTRHLYGTGHPPAPARPGQQRHVHVWLCLGTSFAATGQLLGFLFCRDRAVCSQ